MIKKVFFCFLFFISLSIFSQIEKLNNYKYFIVNNQFSFLKKPDQYKTSSLTHFLLKKNGFNVFLSNKEMPTKVIENPCESLKVSVIDESSMLTTKSRIVFKDCYDKVVFSSDIGKSKEKNYDRAYLEAIREAYQASFENFKYDFSNEQEIESKSSIDKKIEKDKQISISKPIKNSSKSEFVKSLKTITVLYAQVIQNGFQLVNTKPEVVFIVLKTDTNNLFIIKDKNGILSKKEGKWIAEFYEDGKFKSENYEIKF